MARSTTYQIGRTAPLKLFAESGKDYRIGYKDFCSLYPATMNETEYPIGHPERIILNQEVNWTSSRDNKYKGIIKAFVIPPQHMRVPVLPMKLKNGRLAFPLCSQCSADHQKGLKASAYSCTHNDEERGWVATLTHIELNAALDRGYRLTSLIRVLHWKKWSSEVFKPYIRLASLKY
jgi:hypothetical protein